jgi:hypothetical protein
MVKAGGAFTGDWSWNKVNLVVLFPGSSPDIFDQA